MGETWGGQEGGHEGGHVGGHVGGWGGRMEDRRTGGQVDRWTRARTGGKIEERKVGGAGVTTWGSA